MSTLKQLEANPRNAQNSTGPRTEAGRAISAANALKSGIYSTREVLPDEDPAELEALSREYHDHFKPATPDERDLVDDLVSYTWFKRRFRRMEVLMLAVDAATVFRESTVSVTGQVYDRNSSHLARLQTRINAAHRNYRQSLADLTARQEARRTAELREPAVPAQPRPAALPAQAVAPPPQPAETECTSAELASFCNPPDSALTDAPRGTDTPILVDAPAADEALEPGA
jgi:hypothetical protein